MHKSHLLPVRYEIQITIHSRFGEVDFPNTLRVFNLPCRAPSSTLRYGTILMALQAHVICANRGLHRANRISSGRSYRGKFDA